MIIYTQSIDGLDSCMLEGGFFVGWSKPPSAQSHMKILKGSYCVWLAIDTSGNKKVNYFMRVRKKKNADKRISDCAELVIECPQDIKGIWHTVYQNKLPLYLEIGCGKGDFVCGMAQKYPEVNFIAMEKIPDVIVVALEKAKRLELKNVRFIIEDAADIPEYFAEGEISQIYLNFSDPWKKRYQHSKRLTHISFLDMYKAILKESSKIFFKTDNRELFDFSVKSFSQNGFTLDGVTYNLHDSEFATDNIMTEYEKNFATQGIPICRLAATLASSH